MVGRLTENEYQRLLGGPILPIQLAPSYRRRTKPKAETSITGACLDLLTAWGVKAWRHNTGGVLKQYRRKDGTTGRSFIKFGDLGSADIIGLTFKSGRFFGCETKTAENDLDDDQIIWRDRIIKHGGIYILARNTDELAKHKHIIMG